MVLRIWSFHPQKFSRGKNSQLPEWNQQGHLNEGTMHFFGGVDYNMEGTKEDFRRQHFSIESNFNGKMPKMIKHEDLEIGFHSPACTSFELTHKLIKTSVVDIRDSWTYPSQSRYMMAHVLWPISRGGSMILRYDVPPLATTNNNTGSWKSLCPEIPDISLL